jgi:hypothetical protein
MDNGHTAVLHEISCAKLKIFQDLSVLGESPEKRFRRPAF